MMKYNMPKINIIHFLTESIVTDSNVQPQYIQEIANVFGDSPTEYKQRMKNFNKTLEFTFTNQ